MMGRKVVVTGLGPVTAVGIGKDKYWQSLLAGKSGVSEIDAFDPGAFTCRIGAQIRDFEPIDFVSLKETKRMDRFCHFAIAGSRLAMDDSGLEVSAGNAERVGVIIGSGIGGLLTLEDQHKVLLEKGPGRVSPFLVPMMISNMAAGYVSIALGAKGPNYCTVTACASSAHAIGDAFEIIKRGAADACVAGGCEAPITPLSYAGFCASRSLSTRNDEPQRASRPFDADRDGFVMGEGAGIIVLEEAESAVRRGAKIYAEIVGFGATGDAYHITAPSPDGDGAARAMQAAIDEGGIAPEEVDYINAHGTSTKYNDEFETMGIKTVFGSHAYEIAISSTKSMTGHLLGAAGGIEVIATAMVLSEGRIPPTINLENPDPLCDLDYVPNKAIERRCRAALSNSLGFGGHNATLALKNFEG